MQTSVVYLYTSSEPSKKQTTNCNSCWQLLLGTGEGIYGKWSWQIFGDAEIGLGHGYDGNYKNVHWT